MSFWNGKASQTGAAKDVAGQSKGAPQKYREAFKMLRTNLKALVGEKPCHTIAVTSAIPGEGKTCVAVELAKALAESGSRVLLLDCNLRNPGVQEYLAVSARKGLTDVLNGSPVSEAVAKHSELKLDVITAGAVVDNPSELLESKQMQQMMDELTQQYEYIILDTPAAAAVTDAAVVARRVDGVLLVLRQDSAKMAQAVQAKCNLEQAGAAILGVVLNGCDASVSAGRDEYYSENRK